MYGVLLPIPLPPQSISACCWRWAEMQFPFLTNDESQNFLFFSLSSFLTSSGSCFGPLTVAALFTGFPNMAGRESSCSIQGSPYLCFQITLAIHIPRNHLRSLFYLECRAKCKNARHMQSNQNYSSMAPKPTHRWALVLAHRGFASSMLICMYFYTWESFSFLLERAGLEAVRGPLPLSCLGPFQLQDVAQSPSGSSLMTAWTRRHQ